MTPRKEIEGKTYKVNEETTDLTNFDQL